MTEFRFPPLTLTDPTGVDPVLERAPARASCCGNCDQGLPCASSGGRDGRDPSCASPCSGGDHARPAQSSSCRPTPQIDEAYVLPPSTPRIAAPLSAEPARGEIAKKPFWKPQDLEVNLKPMRNCCEIDPETGKCDSGPPCPDDDIDPDYEPPLGHCGPIPRILLEEWNPNALKDPDVLKDNLYLNNINSWRCGFSACSAATSSCTPITAGMYSPLTRAQPVFSYSRWKDGMLEQKKTPNDAPPHGLADCSLIRAIAYHIDSTGWNDEVFIAIPAWSNVAWPIAQAARAASLRNVTVRTIGGGGSWAVLGKWIRESLNAENLKDWPSNCPSFYSPPTYPNGQISHNKFVLIHRAFSKQFLVLITSANWAGFDISRNCDLLTIENKAIYDNFRAYWDSLESASPNNFVTPYVTEVADLDPTGRGITAQFWPRLVNGVADTEGYATANNPLVQILRKYKKDKNTKVRLATATWRDDAPGRAMVQELKNLRAGGADVRVIGNHHLDKGCHPFEGCRVQPGVGSKEGSCETREEIWEYLNNTTIDYPAGPPIPWAKCGIHAKFFLVSGFLNDTNKWHQAVYTGSMNVSYERNMPDSFVGIHNDPLIFAQYENWWNWLCKNIALSRGGSLFPVCGGAVSL